MSDYSEHPLSHHTASIPHADTHDSESRSSTEPSQQRLSSMAKITRAYRACIVRYDFHPGDSRIENQAQALIEDGFEVDVLCVRFENQPYTAVSNGVRIIRLPALSRFRGNLFLYAAEYGLFCLVAFLALSFMHIWRRYKIVQVCNLPDFLVFVALIPKLSGAKIILDFRENMVEMNMAKFGLSKESPSVRILSWLEQICVRFANQVSTCTEQMKNATIERGTPADKVFVMLNSVDPRKFYQPKFPDAEAVVGSEFNIITHGSIIPRYGHETLIRSMDILRKDAPEARLLILGSGQQREEMEALTRSLGLDSSISFLGFVPYDELMEHLENAHVGAVTMVQNPETDLVHTIKMQEYMVMGLPIAISRTSAVEGYFDNTTVQFFEAENPEDLAAAFLRLRNSPSLRRQLAENAYERCERLYKTSEQKRNFAKMVRGLTLSKKQL